MANTIFEEKQKFNQPWIRICLVLLIAIFTWGVLSNRLSWASRLAITLALIGFSANILLVGGLVIFFFEHETNYQS